MKQERKEEMHMLSVEYVLERSRTNGAYWNRLCHTHFFSSMEEAEAAFDAEHREHPSDWLRIVKVEKSVAKETKQKGKTRNERQS